MLGVADTAPKSRATAPGSAWAADAMATVLAPAPDCDAVMRKPQNAALAAAAPQNANAARRGHQGLFR